MPVDPEQLKRALDAIRKEYGPQVATTGDSFDDPPRISTGSLELDLITKGGIPIGRWSHFYGSYMSGKSMTAYKVIGNAQSMGLVCAYYNTEKQLSKSWPERHGIDMSKLQVIETTVIEEIGSIMETLLGSVHVHVIDSIPAGVSQDELAAETGDWLPGISARAWGKTLRRAQSAFDSKDNTVIMINHLGTSFGKFTSDAPKGGRALEYLSSLSLEFSRTSWLFDDKSGNLALDGEGDKALDKRDREPTGIEFAVRAQKTRVSTPFKKARMRMDFETCTIDDMWSLAKAASVYEIVKRDNPKSAWYTMPDGSKVQGDPGLRRYIEENPDFKQHIIETIAS